VLGQHKHRLKMELPAGKHNEFNAIIVHIWPKWSQTISLTKFDWLVLQLHPPQKIWSKCVHNLVRYTASSLYVLFSNSEESKIFIHNPDDSEVPQILIISSLDHKQPIHRITTKSVYNFWVIKLTNRQTKRQTVTSLPHSTPPSMVQVINFYARKQLLLSARLSHRNSVSPSIHLSHGWISQKWCKLELPNLHCRLHGRL